MGDVSEHFSRWEIECRCGCGHIIINPYLLYRLELVRCFTGFRMGINSWCRCEYHNRMVGGVVDSEHITGEGVDVSYNTPYVMLRYLFAFPLFGFSRVIIYPERFHVGVQPNKYHPYFEIKEGVEEWLKTNY